MSMTESWSGKKGVCAGEAQYRMQPNDLDNWHVRNSKGDMVPFSLLRLAVGSLAPHV